MAIVHHGPVVLGRRTIVSKKYPYWTNIGVRCVLLCQTADDTALLATTAVGAPDGARRITKAQTDGGARLVVALANGPELPVTEARLQFRYVSVLGRCVGWANLLLARDTGELRLLPMLGRTREVTGQREVVQTVTYQIDTDQTAGAQDELVFALDLVATAGTFDFLDVTVSSEAGDMCASGSDLIGDTAASAALPAPASGDDLAGLIGACEARAARWAQREQALLSEIDELRRELDRAELKLSATAARN
jgi:hypothetical protein